MTRVFYNSYFHYHLKNKRNVTLTRERTYMMIYLDYAATTPMSAEALQTYTKAASQYFGNEQSLHDIEERPLLYYKFVEKHLPK